MLNKITSRLKKMAQMFKDSDKATEIEKQIVEQNTRQVWAQGIGPKEFGMSYLGSNLRKSRQIKAKRFAKQQKCR